MRQRVRGEDRVAGHHLLVAYQVHRDEPGLARVVDPVVGRPEVSVLRGRARDERSRRLGDEEDCHRGERRDLDVPPAAVGREEVEQPDQHRAEPPQGRQLPPGADREGHDARDAPEDVEGVAPHAVGHGPEAGSELLPGPDHQQRDDEEEEPGHGFDGHHEPRRILGLVLGPEEHQLRRERAADLDHAARALPDRLHPVCTAHRDDQEGGRRREECEPSARRQAPDRHTQEAGEEHGVGEERQEQHVRREPPDAREFEKQHQGADQEEVELGTGPHRRSTAGVQWVEVAHVTPEDSGPADSRRRSPPTC